MNLDAEKAKADAAAIKRDIEELKRQKAEIDVTVRAAKAELELANIEKRLHKINTTPAEVEIGMHGPYTELAELEMAIRAIDETDVSIDVELDAMKAIGEAAALTAAIEAFEKGVDLDIPVDTGGIDQLGISLAGVTSKLGAVGKGGVIGGLALLATTLAPITAVAAGVAGGMVSSFSVMGVSVGAFTGLAIPTIKEVVEGFKLLNTETKNLTPEKLAEHNAKLKELKEGVPGIYAAAQAVKALKDRYMELSENLRPIVIGAMTSALEVAETALNRLSPAAMGAGRGIRQLMNEAKEGIKGDEWSTFFTYLKDNSRGFTVVWGQTWGNFLTGIANMIVAFDPLTKMVNQGFLDMSKNFRQWSKGLKDNEGFKSFIEYVKTNGPLVWDFFKGIVKAIIALGTAIAPVGVAVMKALLAFAQWAAKQEELKAAFSGFMEAVKPVVSMIGETLLTVFKALTPVLTNLFVKFGEIATALQPFMARMQELVGYIMPILVPALKMIITVITGIIKGIIDGAIQFYDGIKGIVQGVIQVVKGIIQIFQGDFKQGFKTVWDGVKQIFVGAFNAIVGALKVWMNVSLIGFIRGGVVKLLSIWKGGWSAIKSAGTAVWNAIKGALQAFLNGVKSTWTATWNGIKSVFSGVWNAIKGVATAIWNSLKGNLTAAMNGMRQAVNGALQAIKGLWSAGWNALKGILKGVWGALKSIVSAGVNGVISLVRGIPGKVKAIFAGAGSWLLSAGKDIIGGLVDGISSMIGAVQDKLSGITKLIPDWKGPAEKDKKLLRPVGKMIMEGLIKGFDDGTEGVKNVLEKITGLIVATMNKRFEDNEVAAAKAKEVIKALDDEAAALMRNARQRENVMAKIDKQKEKLEGLIQAQKDYAASVRDSVMEFGSIGNLGGRTDEEGNQIGPTAGTIVEDMKKKLDEAKTYKDYMKQLIEMDLNQDTLDQLTNMGVEAGLATAKAIIDGGQATVDEINILTERLKATGQQMGDQVAKKMYDAGVQSTKGIIRGLNSQKQELIATAKALAKAMTEAFRRELKIKSPSRVFIDFGHMTGQGLVQGLKDEIPKVESATKSLTDSMNNMGGTNPLGWAQNFSVTDTHSKSSAGGSGDSPEPPPVEVKVYIGDKELTDIVRVEVGDTLKPLRTKTRQGAI